MQLSGEFWAAIVGAVVGGVFSVALQLIALRTSASDRRASELSVRQGHARSLLFKVIKIQSAFLILKRHADECRQKAMEHGAPFGWSWLVALANLPRPIFFSSDEMGTLLACKDNDLFNDLAAFDDVHNGLAESLALYRTKRTALSEVLPAQMNGLVGTVTIEMSEFARLAPRIAELDQLAVDLVESFDRESDPDLKLSSRLSEAFNRSYNLGVSLHSMVSSEKAVPDTGIGTQAPAHH